MDSATAEHIIIVSRCSSIQLCNCRGECYDGASSMAGNRSGVATTLQQWEPRALYTHCYGRALNLAVQDSVKNNTILQDTLDAVEEMTKLIRKSPKHDVIFKRFKMIFQLNFQGDCCAQHVGQSRQQHSHQ